MDLQLRDKVIVVTGGALGIGEAITVSLAAEGAIPVVVGKDAADNEAVMKRIGGHGFHVVAELSDPGQCREAIARTTEKFGRVDGLVNNAGVNDGIDLEHGTYEKFIGSIHKNLVHYYLMAHHVLPFLKISRGAIVNISSKTAETGQGSTSAYAAANGGRNALTREWAVELLKYGIRVNSVIVAECFTPMYQNWIKTLPDPDQMLRKINSRIPLGNRMTTAEEIANMVVFLLSERSSHTTGQLIHVDGGYVHLDRAIGN
jgi:L-fucose dehydrogenase